MLKRTISMCLMATIAFFLYSCSKDETPEISNNNGGKDSTITGIYLKYNFKGKDQLFTYPKDTIAFALFNGEFGMLANVREGDVYSPDFYFSKEWPTSLGTYTARLYLWGFDNPWATQNVQYTITRNAAAVGDTLEGSFKGVLNDKMGQGTDTATISGQFRVVRQEFR